MTLDELLLQAYTLTVKQAGVYSTFVFSVATPNSGVVDGKQVWASFNTVFLVSRSGHNYTPRF